MHMSARETESFYMSTHIPSFEQNENSICWHPYTNKGVARRQVGAEDMKPH